MLLLGLFLESKFTYIYLFVFLLSFRLCSLVFSSFFFRFFFIHLTVEPNLLAHLSVLSFSFTCNYCFHSTPKSMLTVTHTTIYLLQLYFHLTFFYAFSSAEWEGENATRKVIVTSEAFRIISWNTTLKYRYVQPRRVQLTLLKYF